MESALEPQVRSILEALEAHVPGQDLAPLRERLAKTRGLAPGWLGEALDAVANALEGLDEAPREERFRRFDRALEVLSAVREAAAKGGKGDRPAALLEALESVPAPAPAADERLVDLSRAPAPGESRAPLADALEDLSGAIVAVSGADDASGFESVEKAVGAARKRAMEAGGGAHLLIEALDATERLAAAARRGELRGDTDARAALAEAARGLGELASGDTVARKRVVQIVEAALGGNAPARAAAGHPAAASPLAPRSAPAAASLPAPAAPRPAPAAPRPAPGPASPASPRVAPAPQPAPGPAAAASADPAPRAPSAAGTPATVTLASEREMVEGFLVESREHLQTAEGGLLTLEQDPRDAATLNALFRAFHSIKGVAGLLALAPIVKLTHALESLLDSARKGTRPLDRGAIDALLEARDLLAAQVDAVEKALARGAQQATLPGPEGLVATLDAVREGRASAISHAPAPAISHAPPPGTSHVAAPSLETAPAPVAPAAFTAPAAPAELPVAPAAEAPVAPSPARVEPAAAPRPGVAPGSVASGVRVPMDRLDHLVELVGELVISQAQVGHDLTGAEGDGTLTKETNRLGKITREVQDLSLTLRMLPIQPVFQKLQRLVRDVARATGKQVRLETEGEDTRLDKSVIDELEDPLVHMVRNAIDHGLEDAEQRRRSGKSETGVVKIAARHAGGEIRIEIEDDGKGLDKARILEKARARGLAPLDSTPPDTTIWGYIFEPGLSTASAVTELSGRGVGMDVVKRNITKLRGKIEIASVPGKGTRFSIGLPLTLAIVGGMIVKVATEYFTLPNFTIEEAFQLEPSVLLTAAGRGELVRVRGQLAPVVRLRQVFGLEPAPPGTPAIAVLVEVGGERSALVVDEIVGQQQIVIKSLEPPFNQVRGVSGATVLGDGRVGLILDVKRLIDLALHPERIDDGASATPPEEPSANVPSLEGKFLVAGLGHEEYGLPVGFVQEIVTLLPVTRIPRVPAFVKGAVNLRGHVIPVVDLRARLGMAPAPTGSETCIVVVKLPRRTVGLIVDSVREVLALRRDATAPTPPLGPGVRADFIRGVATAGVTTTGVATAAGGSRERAAFLLDVERLLAANELLVTSVPQSSGVST